MPVGRSLRLRGQVAGCRSRGQQGRWVGQVGRGSCSFRARVPVSSTESGGRTDLSQLTLSASRSTAGKLASVVRDRSGGLSKTPRGNIYLCALLPSPCRSPISGPGSPVVCPPQVVAALSHREGHVETVLSTWDPCVWGWRPCSGASVGLLAGSPGG